MEKVERFGTDFVKVGKKILITNENIENFQKLGVNIQDNKLIYSDTLLPDSKNGRYSKYNVYGRRIKREELPKICKLFEGECYPYGNTNKSMVPYSYTRQVCQAEAWLPSFIKIPICSEKKDNNVYEVLFEVNDIINRKDSKFELDLLFNINLLQENLGNFDVYEDGMEADDAERIQYVNWELLPPGKVDEEFIRQCYGNKSEEQCREILERYDYIKDLGPNNNIKGINYFSKYFGAKFANNTIVLENVESGNAIYVFHEDWEMLTQLSRSELRRGYSDRVTRIVHTGNWKTKLKCQVEARN